MPLGPVCPSPPIADGRRMHAEQSSHVLLTETGLDASILQASLERTGVEGGQNGEGERRERAAIALYSVAVRS